jgi:hypothetical protein
LPYGLIRVALGIIGINLTGVGDLYIKRGGTVTKIILPTGVTEGGAATTSVAVGTMGVGGATMDANVFGMQTAEVTEPAIHANPPLPPANSMYHHVPSKFFPATLAVPPCGIEPMISYTCPGPLRTFATVLVVTVGLHASTTTVSVGVGVSDAVGVNVGVAVSVPVGTSVAGGAPPGRLQASTARMIQATDSRILLFFFFKHEISSTHRLIQVL